MASLYDPIRRRLISSRSQLINFHVLHQSREQLTFELRASVRQQLERGTVCAEDVSHEGSGNDGRHTAGKMYCLCAFEEMVHAGKYAPILPSR